MPRLWLQTVFRTFVPSRLLIRVKNAPYSGYLHMESSYGLIGRVITTQMQTIRFDKVVRKGLNMTQSDFEKAFYDRRFRLNKEQPFKKSCNVNEGDMLDLIVREEDGKIYGKRVVLEKIAKNGASFCVVLRCVRQIHQLYADCYHS
ncbi:unnamed protein product [Hydatigera taeniaeformis]|uniref:CDC48_N domain-containing protein n=1 Tax=Hydatigena taeniaeformis TaxID=6205 RepID=A0A0R3WU79_HYDTA|nr:unnamed protein product [Hydatigera taeniaeformis]